MIIAQVCLRLATIKGHSKMCSFTVLGGSGGGGSENQSVSGVTTICLTQCNTSPSHRVDQVDPVSMLAMEELGCFQLPGIVYRSLQHGAVHYHAATSESESESALFAKCVQPHKEFVVVFKKLLVHTCIHTYIHINIHLWHENRGPFFVRR